MAMTRKNIPITDPANLALVLLCQVEDRKQVSTVYQFQSIDTRVSRRQEERDTRGWPMKLRVEQVLGVAAVDGSERDRD